MALELYPASAADLPAAVALVNSAYRGDASRAGWTTEADLLGGQRTDVDTLRAQVLGETRALLLAAADGLLVGCVYLERESPCDAYLGMLTIQPTMQSRGFGKEILEGAERFVRDTWGATSLRMTVIAQRYELIAWYERRGYVQTGEREPFPYDDARFGLPKRDDLYMVVLRKSLLDMQPLE